MDDRKTKTEKLKRRAWFKQLDRPLPKWHVHQGASNDCGPYIASIVANGLFDAHIVDSAALARALEGPPSVRGMLLPARIPGWATFPWGVVRVLRRMGLRARWRLFSSTERLRRNLDFGRVTVAVIGQPLRLRKRKYAGWSHYLAVYAWDPEEGWAFVDPQARGGGAFSFQDDESFRRLWANMGRQIIEVWDEERPVTT